ncbi:MAG: hypothetical protein ACE5E8_07760 [Acidimicrobiia bacterium]
MAILQEPNAVFYHPLDDATETLQAQAWSGSGTFPAGKVATALGPAPGPAALSLSEFGPEHEFLGTASARQSVARLTPTVFVVAYLSGTSVILKVGTVSGADITFGAGRGVGPAAHPSVTAINPTTFVIAFRDNADGGHGTTKVGTVSGTDITFGADTEFESAAGSSQIDAATLDATKFIVVYREGATSDGLARVGTVTGTPIALGAPIPFQSAGDLDFVSMDTLSATSFVVAYRDASDSNHGIAKFGTVSGDGITFGAGATFGGAGITDYNSVVGLSSTKFVVAYQDGGGGQRGHAKVGTVAGTFITFGAAAEFNAVPSSHHSTIALSPTTFVVAYRAGFAAPGTGATKVGTVTGTAVSFGPESKFLDANGAVDISLGLLSAPAFVVAYTDVSDSSHGTAKVGNATVYPTAAGATRLAFSAWFRSPNTVPPTTAPPTTTAPPL